MQISNALFLITAFCITTLAQAPSVSEIVDRAAARRAVYIEEFSNLISQENKTFEIFDKKGLVKTRRTIDSTFLVYRLSRDEKRTAEFRNVISVDGRPLKNAEKRTEKLFETIANLESSDQELEKLQEESLRYDEELSISDLSLFQAVALADNLRTSFEFKLKLKIFTDRNDFYVLSYRQVKDSPYIFFDPKKQPGAGLDVFYDIGRAAASRGPRLSGELLIDTQTFNIHRERRLLSLGPEMKLAETVFEYQESEFGIKTPRKIVHTQYRIDSKASESAKDVVVTFTYGKFTKPDVEIKSSEVSH